MEYQQVLSEYATNFQLHDASEEVKRRAKLIILDSITAIIHGNQSSHMLKLQEDISQNEANKGYATIVGRQASINLQMAAFINGIAMVSEEMDEGNPIAKGHPSCHFFPTLLAYAETSHCNGRDFLKSFILGYEIAARAGAAITLRDDIHPHGNWGVIGAIFALGKMKNYHAHDYERGFYLSSSLPNVSLWQPVLEGHRLRDVYVGLNNMHSFLIDHLITAGFSSSPNAMKQIYGGGILGKRFQSEKIIEKLGDEYYLLKTYFKFYDFCRFCHSPMDGVNKLLKMETIVPEDVERVDIFTYSMAAMLNNQNVKNAYAGKFSIPYAVASLFYPKRNQNEERLNFAEKVFVHEDVNMTQLLPDQRNSRVVLKMVDQRQFNMAVSGASGDAYEEGLEERVIEKSERTLAKVLSCQRAKKLIEEILSIEDSDDIATITELMRPTN
ncbi:MmgE/PrpD family protein [Cytobacillus sp. Sa5YUA1]|uniref:MmgE/PrpD family protein n=1 Tax=Cytobacillus stercorigallinarum TaxID=2762240 RepID=A0ABR8QLH7_9BACI|nr:MmgE/PrpD family protein [Cytobacillus stercorigallinarum]MBD7936377.1 MmgE/PrpD family protein [Cytobacillus stercorigallinarum]